MNKTQFAIRAGAQFFGKSRGRKKSIAHKLRKAKRIGQKTSQTAMIPYRSPRPGSRAERNLNRLGKRADRARRVLGGIVLAGRGRRKR